MLVLVEIDNQQELNFLYYYYCGIRKKRNRKTDQFYLKTIVCILVPFLQMRRILDCKLSILERKTPNNFYRLQLIETSGFRYRSLLIIVQKAK